MATAVPNSSPPELDGSVSTWRTDQVPPARPYTSIWPPLPAKGAPTTTVDPETATTEPTRPGSGLAGPAA